MTETLARDKALGNIASGHEAGIARGFIERHVAERKGVIAAGARQAKNNGDLTPEAALQLWLEYLALEDLLAGIDKKIRAGQSASASLTPAMEIAR